MTLRTSNSAVEPGYSILIPDETVARATDYMHAVRVGRIQPGAFLRVGLQGADLQTMKAEDLLGKLFDTKRPQIFAESAVAGDGSDWSLFELGLLGDVSIAMPVTMNTTAKVTCKSWLPKHLKG